MTSNSNAKSKISSVFTNETPSKIVLITKNSKVVRELTTKDEIDKFLGIWSKKTELPYEKKMKASEFEFKISIKSKRGQFWFYHPDGKTMILTKTEAPIWQLEDAESLNSLFGIKPRLSQKK